MKKAEQIIIEINEDVASEFINLGKKSLIDLEHVPFKEFTIKTDVKNTVNTKEELLKMLSDMDDFKLKVKNTKPNDKVYDLMLDDLKKDVLMDVVIEPRKITLTPSYGFKYCMSFTTNIIGFVEGEEGDNFIEELKILDGNIKEEELLSYDSVVKGLVNELFEVIGCISYIQKESKEKIPSKTTLDVQTKKKVSKKKTTSKKTYIYKTKYSIINVPKSEEVSTERTYHVESWFSRGHWRKLKDGTKTWVSESVKKAKNFIEGGNNKKEYKITKVE